MKSIPIPSPSDVISGQYRLEEELGRGGFGMVFRATHLEMNRAVALKTLLPGAAASPKAVERFKRESVLASSLKHPNTITLFDYGQSEEGLLYLVMELLEGHTLKEEMAQSGPMSPERAAQICRQVLLSLDHAHAKGIIHLDLKPENIFLCRQSGAQDLVKVLDFGIARIVNNNDEGREDLSVSMSFGTPKYMAPEQISALPLSPSTDLYALGLILYEALTGEAAFTGRSPLEIVAKQLHQSVPELPDELAENPVGRLYARIAVKDAAQRLKSASEALGLLDGEAPMADLPDILDALNHDGPHSLLEDGWLSVDQGVMGLLGQTPMSDHGGFEDNFEEDFAESTRVVSRDERVDFGSGEVLISVGGAARVGAEAQMSRSTGGPEALAREDMSAQYLIEGSLARDDDSPMEEEATRVMDTFDVAPTQALFMLNDGDLMDFVEPSANDLEAEPTRVRPSRSGAFEALTPAPGPASSPGQSAKIEDTEKTDPNKLKTSEADPSPPERAILFSVGAEAGYIGQASNVPGVHAPVDVDIASADRADRRALTGRIAAIQAARPIHVVEPLQPVPQRPIDRTLVAALAFLGLGMIAVLSVLIVILLLPFLRNDGPPASAAQPALVVEQPALAAAPPQILPVALDQPDVGTKDASVVSEAVDAASAPITAPEIVRSTISLDSTPPGAVVLINDLEVGKTPYAHLADGPSGDFALTLKLDKHEDHVEKITFEASRTLKIALKALPAPEPVVAKIAPQARAKAPVRQNNPVKKVNTAPPRKNNPTAHPSKTGGGKKPNPFGKW